MTMVETKNFLVLFLTRGTDKRKEWPREDGLDVNEKKSSKQSDVNPCTILKTVMRSVMRRRCSRVWRFRLDRRSASVKSNRPGTFLVNRLSTSSRALM